MGSSGCFAVCCSNSWKTSRIENSNAIWKKNLAAKWFCGFTLSEARLPDYSLFTRVRTPHWPDAALPAVLPLCGEQLKAAGLMSEVFTFVDATHLIAKATLWEERDKARQQKIETVQ